MSQYFKRFSSNSPYETQIGFSRAIRKGNFIAVSGTAPISTDGTTIAPGDPAGQARRCFEIIQEALNDLDSDLNHVIRTRIYLTDIADWEAVGRVHGEFFGEIRPASTVLQVNRLIDSEWLIEVEADAVKQKEKD